MGSEQPQYRQILPISQNPHEFATTPITALDFHSFNLSLVICSSLQELDPKGANTPDNLNFPV